MAAGSIFGQKAEKFGEVTKNDLQISTCPIDSNAHAYYIFDKGETYYTIIGDGLKVSYKRHLRIKIIDKNALSAADFAIRLYTNSNEVLSSLKAVSYNLEGDAIIETKLAKRDIITEESNDYTVTKKFAVPNVKEGSILEVEYIVLSENFYTLKPWYFQHQIPTLKSTYELQIPTYFKYNLNSIGFQKIFTTSNTVNLSNGEYLEYKFFAENLPAYPDEAYQRTPNDFMSRVEFELSFAQGAYTMRQSFTRTWEDVDQKLLESEDFGLQLKNTSHHKANAQKLKNSGKSGYDLLNSALELVKSTMVWNEGNSKFTSVSLSKSYKEASGNSADVNFNLYALLKLLDFNAFPVITSTQGNGIIYPFHPTINSFDHVIVLVEMDGVDYLLDATNKFAAIDLLPIHCLNDRGRIISTSRHDWITLMDKKKYNATVQYEYNFDENFTASASVKMQLSDYAAYVYRNRIKTIDNLEDFEKSLKADFNDAKIDSIKIEGFNDLNERLSLSFKLTAENLIQQADEMYFSPAFDLMIESNPFQLEKREFPVEFDYPLTITQLFTINLPANYEVIETPKPLIIKLPENGGSYTFQASKFDNKISLMVKFVRTKSSYLPEEYFSLKEFYTKIVEKQKEFVVVKKKPAAN